MTIDAYYSDPHFWHKNIIEYEERPFSSIEEMNSELIKRYNDVVGHNDFVMWVGDCHLSRHDFSEILSQLNGHKGLVRGNHDKHIDSLLKAGFLFVTDEALTFISGRRCRIAHHPYWAYGDRTQFHDRHGRLVDHTNNPEWLAKLRSSHPTKIPGEALIHGHSHGKKRLHDNMIHVGVDAWDYAPVTHNQVAELVAKI